jgi:hypothetical protein
VSDELWALRMNWAVGDRSTGPALSTALLANTPRSPAISAVVATAPDLKRDAGGVLLVVLGSADLDGHCHRACSTGHHGKPGCVWRSHGKLLATVLIIVCAGA